MESNHGSGNNKHSQQNPEANLNPSEPTTDVKSHFEAKHDDSKPATEASSLGLKQHPEAKHDDSGTNKEGSISHSSHSSSSSSSFDDPLDNSFDKAEQTGPQSPRSESLFSPDVSNQTPQWSMVSASPRSGSGNLSSTDIFPRTPDQWMKSPPPVQAMGRGYDPNRIPSSIFSTKPTTPTDWSVASNESLFSIHMGNNSFSRDSIFLQSTDFSRPEEWNSSPLVQSNAYETKSTELNNFTPNLPPVAEVSESRSKNVYVREGLDDDLHETPKLNPGKAVQDHSKEKLAPDGDGVRSSPSSNFSDGRGVASSTEATHRSVSGHRISNESAKSNESFAFPVLLSDGGKGSSLKVNSGKPETPHLQPQESKSTQKEDPAGWFSRFTCWPRCCC